MMFIIMDRNPEYAVDLLIQNTNKKFYFKQLIELGQLICSTGISNLYKPIKQGKAIQEWIKRYPGWTFEYYAYLLSKCRDFFKSNITLDRAFGIQDDLECYIKKYSSIETHDMFRPESAILKYAHTYSSKYPTNSELPIKLACNEYIKYIKEYKFKENRNGKSIN